MSMSFSRYSSLETETLDHFEPHDEFEANGPFSEQHEDTYSSNHEYDNETETVDQFTFEESDPENEANFSDEGEFIESASPLSEYEIAEEIEHQVAVAKGSAKKAPEKNRDNWAKTALNRILGLNLADDNTLDTATKNAIGDFQSKNNLPVTKNLDATTERALLEADALVRSKGTPAESATIGVIGAAKTKIEDWTKKAVNNKPKFILNSYRDPRKVFALVLHHMAFKRKNSKSKKYSDPESYLATGAHCCILFDGRIIQLHAFSRMIWHSNCTSGGSVGVEFEGNFPNVNGKWWVYVDDKGNRIRNDDKPTQAQYEAGRFLASYLKCVMGITRILAHRQSSKDRENDPGPDVWYNVGQWSIDKLGLSDGGPTSFCGDGKPILPAWRTWGDKSQTTQAKETEEFEDECQCKKKNRRQKMLMNVSNDIASEYSWESENVETEDAYESESDANTYDEMEELVRDWSEAIKANRYYGEKLQWNRYTDKINDMLLPYSGMSNVSLGEDAFAHAVFQWQERNGFTGNNIDGIIGPATWAAMCKKLGVPCSTQGKATPKDTDDIRYVDGVRFRKVGQGWAAYGGGPLREKLYDLLNKRKLSITPTEIEMFKLVSKTESDTLVNAVNSYDNMYMSMGFIQLTMRYYELAQVIKTAPEGFRKHGIEIDPGRKYFPNETNSIAIKNAPNISDLRSFEWAKRFFKAGLEDDVIIAQINVARKILQNIRTRIDKANYLSRFDNQHPQLWAFIYEAHNSRPAPFLEALKKAIAVATVSIVSDPVQFAKILIEQLKESTRQYYSRQSYDSETAKQQRVAKELKKVKNIIENTEVIK